MTFEEKLERLKEIVDKLESPDTLDLDISLSLFEEGVSLARTCRKLLEAAEVRIQNVSEDENSEDGPESLADNGNGEWDGFEEN